jgi:hypothetical protein
MDPRAYTATVDDGRVLILRENVLVGTGRWTGTHIEDLSLELPPAPVPYARAGDGAPLGADAAALIQALERRINEEECEAIAAVSAGACNADGIDLTLIDWILRLNPGERFDVLESYAGIPYRKILEVLARHQVDVLVVGGVAAHFYGASYHTKDMDLVYSRAPENIERLLVALAEMDTIHRDFAGRRILPKASFFPLPTAKLLLTKFGPLDLLGTLSLEEDGTGYEDIIGDAMLVDLAGTPVRILALPRLIAVKERLRRPSDLLVLPILRAALERSTLR